jgi:hypothetical protein
MKVGDIRLDMAINVRTHARAINGIAEAARALRAAAADRQPLPCASRPCVRYDLGMTGVLAISLVVLSTFARGR